MTGKFLNFKYEDYLKKSNAYTIMGFFAVVFLDLDICHETVSVLIFLPKLLVCF